MKIKLKTKSKVASLNGKKNKRIASLSKNKFTSLERLSGARMKQVLSWSAVSAIRQNKKSGVATISTQNGNLVRVTPRGTKKIIRKISKSQSIPKGKYPLAIK